MIRGSGIFKTRLPTGFKASGVNCGVRVYRPDLGLIVSEENAVVAAVYTQNKCKAAPILYSKALTPSASIKAIITNSGEANAATGMCGIKNNWIMAETLATHLGCQPSQVLTASTGVIGKPLSIDKIVDAIPQLIKKANFTAENFATAILTTDLTPKSLSKEVMLSKGKVCITGICKGSGMIHPNMATMLGYLLTDIELSSSLSEKLLKDICNQTFNQISVDGETSTNDAVFFMANGMSGIKIENQQDYDIFYKSLLKIATLLAKSIAKDGEGANKLIEITVSGTASKNEAEMIAKSIATSALIKTAIAGESPNWGRILARLGQVVSFESMLDTCSISLQNIVVFKDGAYADCDLKNLQGKLKDEEIFIAVEFKNGAFSAKAWTCDLTENYVKINAEYLS